MTTQIGDAYEFGGFRLDIQRRLLTCDGHSISLAPKTFDLLSLLVQSRGRALSKNELIAALWSDTFVEEANLSFQIAALRKALGNGASQWIETIPKYGYRFAGEVRAVARGDIDASPAAAAVAEVPRIGNITRIPYLWRWITAIAALLAIVIALSFALLRQPTASVKFTVPVTTPLTTDPGYETTPSFSPDGSQVAFAWSKQSKPDYDIYVKLVGPGEPIPLTTHPARELNPAWSPDGSLIAFERFTALYTADLYVIPALGGAAEQRIATGVAGNASCCDPNSSIAWTPDGKWLAHWAVDALAGIWLFDVHNREKRQLTIDGANPAFSDDGRRMAYIRKVGAGVAVYVLPLTPELTAAGPPVRVTPEVTFIRTIAWTPRSDSLVYSVAGHLGVFHLYRVALAANQLDPAVSPELLPFGENGDYFSLSMKTGKLVYATNLRDMALLRVDLQERQRLPLTIAASTYDEYSPDYSADGQHIAFTSTRTGNEEVWIADADGSKPMKKTSMTGPVCANPRWSPDGGKILFHSTGPATTRALYTLDTATGAIEALTHGPQRDSQASWSRDGQTIYFGSDSVPMSPPRLEIWKMRADGSARVQVTRHGGSFAIESFDRRVLYYAKWVGSQFAIYRVPVDGGEEVAVIGGGLTNSLSFLVARDGLYFFAGSLTAEGPTARDISTRKNTIDFFEFKTGRRRTILELDKRAGTGLALSPDERYLLYSVANSVSRNLMLVDKVE